MTTYEKSIVILRREFKQHDINQDEWDELANENALYSAFTIKTKEKAKDWEELKKKLVKRKEGPRKLRREEYLKNKINRLQSKLNGSVQKNGLNDKKTVEISKKIDEIMNEYLEYIEPIWYKRDNKMYNWYLESYDHLKNYTIDTAKFPTEKEWNKYAKINNCMSAESMKYISNTDWKILQYNVKKEAFFKIIVKKI